MQHSVMSYATLSILTKYRICGGIFPEFVVLLQEGASKSIQGASHMPVQSRPPEIGTNSMVNLN